MEKNRVEGKKGLIQQAQDVAREVREREEERIQLRWGFRKALGLLGFYEYQRMLPRDKRAYRIRHGAPKAPQQKEALEKKQAKRRRREKIARTSRKLNYRVAKARGR